MDGADRQTNARGREQPPYLAPVSVAESIGIVTVDWYRPVQGQSSRRNRGATGKSKREKMARSEGP